MPSPPIFPFLIGALSLIAAHAPAQGGQIGGWHRPLWESEWNDTYPPSIDQIGDVTGDGIDDFIERGSGRFHVVNGLDGSTWFDSYAVLGIEDYVEVRVADLDGDGLQDLVAGFPRAVLSETGSIQVGRICVIQGGSGALLWQAWGRQGSSSLGYSPLLVDLTGDGLADVTTFEYSGHRRAYRGFDGQLIWAVADPLQGAMHLAGDPNADGVPDLFISQGDGDALIDGSSGNEIWSTSRGFEYYPSYATVLTYDITGNGQDDLIVCEPFAKNNEKGWISARSGLDGSQLWRRKGSHMDDRLGLNAKLEDLTGDGLPELISISTDESSYRPATIYVIDPHTGQRIWRHEWSDQYKGHFPLLRVDVNRDGIQDFVLTEFDVHSDTAAIVALDARTGTALWPALTSPIEGWFRQLATADLDQDGVPDFIASGGGGRPEVDGIVVAVSGANGRMLWKQGGALGHDIGHALAVQVLPSGDAEVYSIANPGSGELASLIAWDGRTGEEKWKVDWAATGYQSPVLELVDFNGDGSLELLALPDPNFYENRDFIHLFETANQGRLLWSAEGVYLRGNAYTEHCFGTRGDFDGDGWLDPLFYARVGTTSRLLALSGKDGTWTPGLSMQSGEVSASGGGVDTLQVEAHADRSNKKYFLLFSENGPGETTLGALRLPLAPGLWLSRSAIGIYPPGVFSAPTGRLDQDGKANIQVQIPAGALHAWVGREISFCVAVKLGSLGDPDWTTGFTSLRVLP